MSISTIDRRNFLRLSAATAATAALAGCSTAGAPSASSSGGPTAAYLVAKKDGPFTVGLANSFAGNSWRTQMVAELQHAADQRPNDVKKVIVTDANSSVNKQISQITDLLGAGIDILLIDAASATALNNVVKRAHDQGVLVVSFDSPVTSENGIVVSYSNTKFGKIGGEWLAGKLKSGDSVFTLDGTSGAPVNTARIEAATKALTDAGVKIVAHADTDWDQAKAQSATANLLSAHPDVKGIYSQGGAITLGALAVLEQRNMPLLPIPSESYNGFLKKWQSLQASKGWESISPAAPPSISSKALDVAIQALRGQDPGKEVTVELEVITQENLGEFVKPDLSDSLWLPTALPNDVINKIF